MKHPILDKHSIISWDMDGTLIDGDNAAFFIQYIVAHPEKTHNIVTFRDALWAKEVIPDLVSAYGINPSIINAVLSCPDRLYEAYYLRTYKTPHDLMQSGFDLKHLDAEKNDFFDWKGFISKETGATILVDDMPSWVEDGCCRYGIEFLDSRIPIG